ncbi:hypothetical protein MLD38_019792 [Melastoma candidum]|uniref:Uncharacterized protein n=1 Tax=Melastoma candidum TaxID=119954 RepID=A0ACB9QY77_9MYRT|nr:hypothetical protein MLD38_019792 [Melastoma candidum]
MPTRSQRAPQTEEDKEREYEHFAQYWAKKLAEELAMQDPDNPIQEHHEQMQAREGASSMQTEAGVEEDVGGDGSKWEPTPPMIGDENEGHNLGDLEEDIDGDEAKADRLRKGKQPAEDTDSPPISPPSSDTDSDFEVIDSNTFCTLYKSGKNVAHKEKALLPRVVDKVGVRYKLEWRHTYASVWVWRFPEWICFPKPNYPEGVRNAEAGTSNAVREIMLKPPSLKRKAADWITSEASKRRRITKKNKGNRIGRYVLVEHKGTQTDDLLPDVVLGSVENAGVGIVEDNGGQVKHHTTGKDGEDQENGCALAVEDVLVPGSEEAAVTGQPIIQQLSDALLTSPGSKSPDEDGSVGKMQMAEDEVIILGWKEEGDAASSGAGLPSDYPVDGFVGLDEEMKLVHYHAMKFILENVEILTAEFAGLLDTLIARVRDGAHKKFIFLYGSGGGESSEVGDRSEQEAMEEYRKKIRNDASLLRLDEQILGLKWEIDMMESVKENYVGEDALNSKRLELRKMLGEWKAVVKLKKESLEVELKEWDEALDWWSARGPCPAVKGFGVLPREPSSGNFAGAGPAAVPLHTPDVDAVPAARIPNLDPTTNTEEVMVRRVPSGPDGQPLGAPRSPGPDSRFNNIIRHIYDMIADPVSRPEALDQLATKTALQQRRDIQGESNRAARSQKCRMFRDHVLQLEGVPEYVVGLHEELLHLADEEARRAQEANADSLPFFIIGPMRGTAFDDTSAKEDDWVIDGATLPSSP